MASVNDRFGNEVAMAQFKTLPSITGRGNGQKYDASELVANAIQTRNELLKSWMDPRRDIDKECGYPATNSLSPSAYKDLYDREPIAERVAKVMPNECWNTQPTIVEDEDNTEDTAFEKAFKELGQSLNGSSYHQDAEGGNIWGYLHRLDVLSGIGHFGVMLMGFNDGKNLQEPVEGAMVVNEEYKVNRRGGATAQVALNSARSKVAEFYNRVPDCYLTENEEKTLLDLKDLSDQEKLTINQLREQRTMVLNARGLANNKKTRKPANNAKKSNSATGESGFSGVRQGDIKAPGVVGTDTTYDQAYGALSPFNPMGSLAGTDQQYFGVQFGASEQPSDKPAKVGLKLLFLRPFDESLVQVVRYEWNVMNPRFGQPVMYRITLNDPREQHSGIGLPMATVFVHWSRVIHVADNLNSSEIFGVPRMRPVLNRLLDLLKIYGGDAEGYWRGAITGLSLETHPQLGGDVTIDMADVRTQVENFYNGLQRALGFTGMSAHTLAPSVVDPSSHIDKQIEAICICLGIPKRVFMGSERGELASGQDDAKFNDRIKGRQQGHITPHIIVPFIDRLINVGVLPEPKDSGKEGPRQGYSVRWPDLDSTTERDKSQIAVSKTQAMAAYVAGNVEAIMPLQDFYVRILGMSKEEAIAIIEGAEDQVIDEMEYGETVRLTSAPSQALAGGMPGEADSEENPMEGNSTEENPGEEDIMTGPEESTEEDGDGSTAE